MMAAVGVAVLLVNGILLLLIGVVVFTLSMQFGQKVSDLLGAALMGAIGGGFVWLACSHFSASVAVLP